MVEPVRDTVKAPELEKKPEVIATAEDLRKILDEFGMHDVPVFDVVLPELPRRPKE